MKRRDMPIVGLFGRARGMHPWRSYKNVKNVSRIVDEC